MYMCRHTVKTIGGCHDHLINEGEGEGASAQYIHQDRVTESKHLLEQAGFSESPPIYHLFPHSNLVLVLLTCSCYHALSIGLIIFLRNKLQKGTVVLKGGMAKS